MARCKAVITVAITLILHVFGSLATDITMVKYQITNPSDTTEIVYNRVQDMSITFTVTVDSGSVGGDIDGIEVYFKDSEDAEIDGTNQGAGGEAPTETDKESITGDSGQVNLEGNTAVINFGDDGEGCADSIKLCVKIKGDGVKANEDEHCLSVTDESPEAGTTNCAVLTIDDGSLEVTAPPIADILYTRTDPTEITLTMKVSPGDTNSGQIDAVMVYFSDGDSKESERESGTLEGTSPIPVNDAETPLGNVKVTLKMDSNCLDYEHLCAEILDEIILWDGQCIDLGTDTGNAGDSDCSIASIEPASLKITSPKPSEITYTTHEDTKITFDLKATTVDDDAEVTGVNVYFTNNKNDDTRVESEAVVAEGDAPTLENPVKIDKDGESATDIKGCEATLKLDEENCASYTHLCASLSAVGGVEGEECIEFGSEDTNAGEKDCESAGVRFTIAQYNVLAGLLTVFATQLW